MNFVKLEINQHIATITLNRPESLNALNQAILLELESTLDSLLKLFPDSLRGVVLTGAGSKAFVAGADIKEMLLLKAEQAQEFSRQGQRIFNKIEMLPVPVIAAVNGFALGGGLELALACDWIYAVESAQFALPEVSLGLIPGFGGTARLVEKIGLPKASEMIFSAQKIKAPEAVSFGLVNQIFRNQEALMQASYQTLNKISNMGPRAVAQAKRLLQKGRKTWLEQALDDEAEVFGDLFNLADVAEGLTAFAEKRAPHFKGE
jgi:enoyl-CoA hydratase